MLTMTGLLNTLLRWRRLLLTLAVAGLVLAVAWSVLRASYQATASFTPSARSSTMQGTAGVAQALGINLGGLGAGEPSLGFYVALLRSRELIRDLILTRYRYQTDRCCADSTSTTLLEVYGFGDDTTNHAVQSAIRRAQEAIDVSADQSANLITVKVRAEAPALAEAIASRLLELVSTFNIEQLQSRASAERRFVEQRRDMARTQLGQTEDSLRKFLERNRSYANSPRLVFEEQRLERIIGLQQQLYTRLAESYEQARIAEVRDTPVITVVDAPDGSALRRRHAVRNGLAGLALGFVLGIIVAFGVEYFNQEWQAYPEEYAEFSRLRQRFLGGVFAPRRSGRAVAPDDGP